MVCSYILFDCTFNRLYICLLDSLQVTPIVTSYVYLLTLAASEVYLIAILIKIKFEIAEREIPFGFFIV